jgi:hypothetical protein
VEGGNFVGWDVGRGLVDVLLENSRTDNDRGNRTPELCVQSSDSEAWKFL